MILAENLRMFRTAAVDYEETELIKSELARKSLERQPFFLTGDELERIFRWKLRSQYGRKVAFRQKNTESAYRVVTKAAFEIVDQDFDYECPIRLGLLMALPGIGIGVASAILALAEPQRYCVIDFRGWRVIFGEDRGTFSITDYLRYRNQVGQLADELGWSVQETDLAIWEYDRQKN